ncbi:uncharacterized protein LOC118768099 [Octopus sinensis]|uniref:Uncharacterized protein LOC118768099 n=1 Tax=Octopus sinensis TaxID=2607531 RepID=A0A7E6FQH7_9MOLL|nr:uncharacterized protein LOC118768099 [Octopus sinensis]
MNLKGMETSIQCHLILLLLPALTLVVFVTPTTGESANRNGLFRKISSSKCISDQRITTAKTVSAIECSSWCMSQDECQYFSYCKGTCHIHGLWYDKEIEDYDCNCSLYISFPENGTNWQRMFKMTENSFTRSLIYLYCDKFPMEKERILPESQCVIRALLGTIDTICARQFQNKYREQENRIFLIFSDLQKFFDTVPRSAIWTALDQFLLPDHAMV